MKQQVRKAIFPVAGLGTRFLPATKAQPKEMLPIVDKPLIQYAVEEAYEAGIRDMIFVTGRGKGDAAQAPRDCGEAVNKGVLMKSLEVVQREGAHLLYVAAAADNEVSYASAQGSLATQAWLACLKDPAADTDRSGSISGDELKACAQVRVDANKLGVHQTITLNGTAALPLSFTAPPRTDAATAAAPS